MENKAIPELGFCDSAPANKYREDLGQQLVYAAYDDCDYDIDGYFIPFLDYIKLLQDEWLRVNNGW